MDEYAPHYQLHIQWQFLQVSIEKCKGDGEFQLKNDDFLFKKRPFN